MIGSVFIKTLYQRRYRAVSWAIGGFALTLLTMVFYPSFKSGGFDDLYKTLPPQLASLVGDAQALRTLPGFLGQEVMALRVPMLTLILAISIFSGLTAGDEERGVTAEQLTLPIPRWRLLTEKTAAAFVFLGVASAGVFAAVVFSFALIHDSMSLTKVFEAVAVNLLLSATAGMITFLIGTATGSKSLTTGIAGTYVFTSFVITTMVTSVESLKSVERFSLFHYYQQPQISTSGIIWSDVAVLFSLGLGLYMLGIWLFSGRDLKK